MRYSLNGYERETLISFNEAEDMADITAYSPAWIRKFDKLCKENPEQFKCKEWDTQRLDGRIIAKRYEFPKRFISIRTKDVKRELTDEQREQARERIKELYKMRSTR